MVQAIFKILHNMEFTPLASAHWLALVEGIDMRRVTYGQRYQNKDGVDLISVGLDGLLDSVLFPIEELYNETI